MDSGVAPAEFLKKNVTTRHKSTPYDLDWIIAHFQYVIRTVPPNMVRESFLNMTSSSNVSKRYHAIAIPSVCLALVLRAGDIRRLRHGLNQMFDDFAIGGSHRKLFFNDIQRRCVYIRYDILHWKKDTIYHRMTCLKWDGNRSRIRSRRRWIWVG